MLLEPDGSLEGAVARSSLAAVLQDVGPPAKISPAQVVTKFLAESLYQRLVLDLGEPLEAPELPPLAAGLDGLKADRRGGAGELMRRIPRQRRGLAGWTWVAGPGKPVSASQGIIWVAFLGFTWLGRRLAALNPHRLESLCYR
jgi:hypothetical protein